MLSVTRLSLFFFCIVPLGPLCFSAPPPYQVTFQKISQSVNGIAGEELYANAEDTLAYTVRLRIVNNTSHGSYFDVYTEISRAFLIPVSSYETKDIFVAANSGRELILSVTTDVALELGEDYASYDRCYRTGQFANFVKLDHGQATWEFDE